MYPMLLKMTGRLAVVVGGGEVGLRKARLLFDAGARVRMVCLEPCPADGLTGRLEWLREPFAPHHLDGATLAIAAGPPEVNRAVAEAARQRNVLVNVAAEPDLCDFVLPATIRRGDFVLAIGTGGAAPSLAQRVREQLEQAFDKAFGEWVELLAELRPLVRERFHDPDQRAAALHALSDWAWLERIREVGCDQTRLDMYAALDRWAAELRT
jgi:precorrin-2 dehydrogenase/sirohydrochlorin ferrochelatase